MQKILIWLDAQEINAQTRIRSREWYARTAVGFSDTDGSPDFGQNSKPSDCQQKNRTYRIVDLTVPLNHRIEFNERGKVDKYIDLARELKNLWNMKVTVIPGLIGTLSLVTKRLVKGLEDWK